MIINMEIMDEIITDFWIAAKIAILIFLGIYIIFSAVVTKQAKLMAETLDVELDNLIVVVSYIHMALAICIFLTSVVLL